MNHTTNYQLNQWVKDDQVRMEDFNADNAKIDAAIKAEANARAAGDAALQTALAAVPKIATGTYVGSGTHGSDHPNSLTLPFEAKFIAITGVGSAGYFIRGGSGICNWQGNGCSNWTLHATWEGRKLTWYSSGYTEAAQQLNANSTTYTYFAIG